MTEEIVTYALVNLNSDTDIPVDYRGKTVGIRLRPDGNVGVILAREKTAEPGFKSYLLNILKKSNGY